MLHFGIWKNQKWDIFFCVDDTTYSESIPSNTQRYKFGILITVFDISNLSIPSQSTH